VESGKANASLVKALSQLKTQVYSPEGRMKRRWTTPDRWPHRRIWLWDSAFHAIGLRHVDPQLAKDAVEAIFDVQAPDGFIPHMASPSKSSEITQPPVLAFAVGLVNEKLKDRAWLASLYPKLKAYLEWDMRHRDRDGAGLLEWFIENSPTCRSGESGADNSTRFDRASNLDAPDFNAYLAQDFETMASFAAELGMAADVKLWRERLAKINGLMNERLWDDALGLYMDFDNDAGRQSDVMSFAAFLPLLCGAASQSQAAKLVAHLKNPDTFGTPLPIPTIAKCQSQYYSKDMWRGPVWININWLVARGLRRYGYAAEAAELLRKTVAEIELMRERYGTFFEFYDDQRVDDPPKLLRKGSNDPANPYHQVLRDYGWSASLYVEMLLA
jgi:glycogen debranching enzyme